MACNADPPVILTLKEPAYDVYDVGCVLLQCGLCGFRLHDGDKFIAIIDDEREMEAVVDDRLRTARRIGHFYQQCYGDCPHGNLRAAGCHSICAKLLPTKSRMSFLKVLEYAYEPSAYENAARIKWLRQEFASSLVLQKVAFRLPLELRMLIAEYTLESHALYRFAEARAMLQAESLLDKTSLWNSTTLRIADGIWARYIELEGIRYIASLSNSCDQDHCESFVPDPTQPVDSMYAAENYLGVLRVVFCTSDQAPATHADPGIWWRRIQLASGHQTMLETRCDGLKLRTILASSTSDDGTRTTLQAQPLWALPPLSTVRWVHLRNSRDVYRPIKRMSMLECNEPGVAGYSACYHYTAPSIHPHIPGQAPTFYGNFPSPWKIWLYFPLDPGEKVSEILRFGVRYPALAFNTTHGRTAFFGAYGYRKGRSLILFDRPTQQECSRVYLETGLASGEFTKLAFETPAPVVPRDFSSMLSFPVTLSRPRTNLYRQLLHSYATLDGVERITPCECSYDGTRYIVGLLLEYPNNRQRCLGQVRLDCLGRPIPIPQQGQQAREEEEEEEEETRLWLGFAPYCDHPALVRTLTTVRPTLAECEFCIEIRPSGALEWWFSHTHCLVYYSGNSNVERCLAPNVPLSTLTDEEKRGLCTEMGLLGIKIKVREGRAKEVRRFRPGL